METEEYFDKYSRFVDAVTAEVSKNDKLCAQRFELLSKLLEGNFSRLDNAIAGLTGEAGEVADVWKKVKYNGLEYNESIRDMFIKELGDVCWYMFQTALALNVPFEEIINRNIEKLQKRHPHGFSSAYITQKKED